MIPVALGLAIGAFSLLLGFRLGVLYELRKESQAEETIAQGLAHCGRLIEDCARMRNEQSAALDRTMAILDDCDRMREERQAALDEARELIVKAKHHLDRVGVLA